MTNYVVASSKSWFSEHSKSKEFNKLQIYEISDNKNLNLEYLSQINPRFIFFPHWSWKISSEIYEIYDCVIFHTAPLPFGRGGSPIQNLILNGFKESPVCAIKVTEEIDAGPIYESIEVSLSGNIDQIFQKISVAIEKLIISICKNNPLPIEQSGKPFVFQRLNIKDNELQSSSSIRGIYDRIRMVDGKDYSKAYMNFGDYKIEFKNAELQNDYLYANVVLFNPNDSNIIIRQLEKKDSIDIFEWRNDSLSRSMFVSTEPIAKEEHNEWFNNSLKNPLVTIYLGMILDIKLGVCRFDFNPKANSAEVSINLNPIMRGKNLSYILLRKAISNYKKNHEYDLTANIKKKNLASIRLFENCDFIQTKSDDTYLYFILRH